MGWRRELTKLGALFRRRKPVDDLAEEIRAHLANGRAGEPGIRHGARRSSLCRVAPVRERDLGAREEPRNVGMEFGQRRSGRTFASACDSCARIRVSRLWRCSRSPSASVPMRQSLACSIAHYCARYLILTPTGWGFLAWLFRQATRVPFSLYPPIWNCVTPKHRLSLWRPGGLALTDATSLSHTQRGWRALGWNPLFYLRWV